MMGHTPGPWYAKTYLPESGIEHKVVADEAGLIPICHTGRWDSASADDALLIASAPDMLEALEGLMASVASGDGVVKAMIDAAKAVAKAKGL